MKNTALLENILRALRQTFIFCIITLFSSINVYAGSLTLAWDPSTSPIVDGYVLYYGTASKVYSSNIDVGKVTSYKLPNLVDGKTYYFAVKAYDNAKNLESKFSNEAKGTVSAVAGLTKVDFTASTSTGIAPLTVTFTPKTTGTITKWNWNFGASGIPASSSKISSVTFTQPGTYAVSLSVVGANGTTVVKKKTGFIKVSGPPPVANFVNTSTSGISPLFVNFLDNSTGYIKSREWNFGDGTKSTAANIKHIYKNPGIYTVSLTVSSPDGSNTKTIPKLIKVVAPVSQQKFGSLVASYSFDEIGNNVAVDSSGRGNHGKIFEAVRVNTGHNGRAIQFDGINDSISVKSNYSLDLSLGFTLEAWVNLAARNNNCVICKEQPGGSVYALQSSDATHLPAGSLHDGLGIKTVKGTKGLPANVWTHITTTFDGLNQKLYVNGVLAAVQPQKGLVKQSNGFLKIGGNSILGTFFKGLIDDVRIYNKALNIDGVAKDFATPVGLSNPAKIVLGDKIFGKSIDSIPQGQATATQVLPTKTAMLTSLNVYFHKKSAATLVTVGLYSNIAGHPGKLLETIKVRNPIVGKVNEIKINPTVIKAGVPYWIALLSTSGEMKIMDHLSVGTVPMEFSVSSNLKKLPTTWEVGSTSTLDGPFSSYGTGFVGP